MEAVLPGSAAAEYGRLSRGGESSEDAAIRRVNQERPVPGNEIGECVPRVARGPRHGELPVQRAQAVCVIARGISEACAVLSDHPEGAEHGGQQEDKADLQIFIDWVIPRMEAFLMFESSLPKDAP